MTKKRKRPSTKVADEVMCRSALTCCVCKKRDNTIQIHHIDKDPFNNDIENLAVLCLECHNKAHIRGGVGRHLTASLIFTYREEWYKMVKIEKINEAMRSARGVLEDAPHAYIETIPEIRQKLLKTAQPEWDSGVTIRMVKAHSKYIDGLKNILVKLAAFFPKGAFGSGDKHEFFSEIISSKFKWHRSLTETQFAGGTIAGVICGGAVSSEVEKMVEDMVQTLLYSEYSLWKTWKKEWDLAIPA